MKKLNGRLAKLEKEVKSVKDDVSSLTDRQSSTEKDVQAIQSEIKSLKETPKESDNSEDVLAEMKDREERKLNVIINGVKESTASEKDQVQEEENNMLNELITNMQLDVAPTTEKIKFKTRLGPKKAGMQRPFLVKFRDQGTRDKVIRNAQKITTPGIRIRPDLTKRQREEDEKFKRNVDAENRTDTELKDEAGDFRWKVAGPPGNLRKVKTRDIQEWERRQQQRREREERE